jgi:SAM-dependent methyltransferase
MQASLWHMRQAASYWRTPSGLAQLAWEQRILETFNEGAFGYYALSVELNHLNLLHTSTIPHVIRVDAAENYPSHAAQKCGYEYTTLKARCGDQDLNKQTAHALAGIDLQSWPIDNNTLDYIVLPHVLEFSLDPHAILREAERCLRPGGYIAITAFNPHSLLGIQAGHIELGYRQHWLTRRRLLDWMQLLNLYPDRGAFGQWRPMSEKTKTFEHLAWLDKAGERWWPHFANVFAMRMVKRVPPDTRQVVLRGHSLLDKILRPATATAILDTPHRP